METIFIGSRKHVTADSIKLLEADVNYTTIYFKDGTKVLVSTTMGTIESRLPKDNFVRVNRSIVVNRSAVSHYFIRPDFDEVKLEGAQFVKVSRRRKMEMRKILTPNF
jgi:two-component system LytT family response regulator